MSNVTSGIKATQMDGDLSVGRNVSLGGNLLTQGKARIKGELRVDGRLFVNNIESTNKGLFPTVDALREAYPSPRAGSWAYVGTEMPAAVYIVANGAWEDSGGTSGDVQLFNAIYDEAIEQLQNDSTDINERVVELENFKSSRGENDGIAPLDPDGKVPLQHLPKSVSDIGNLETGLSDAQRDIDDLQDSLFNLENYTLPSMSREITTAQTGALNASNSASEAKSSAEEAQRELNTFKNSKGVADGLAPLGPDGKVPSSYMPAPDEEVLEFAGINTEVITPNIHISKYSTDTGCEVMFSDMHKIFVLKVTEGGSNVSYYAHWLDSLNYQSGGIGEAHVPHRGRIFLSSDNKGYRWNGTELRILGSDLALGTTTGTAFDGGRGAAVENKIDTVRSWTVASGVVNVNRLLSLQTSVILTFENVLGRLSESTYKDTVMMPGVVLAYFSSEGWKSYQWVSGDAAGNWNDAAWNNPDNWASFGGSANVGNCYNVTNEEPLPGIDFYTLETASAKTYEKGFAAIGMQITFAIAPNSWKTYQYIGNNTEETNFKAIENWVDLAGMSAGAETLINVDALCGTPITFYNLSSAISALVSLHLSSGIGYAKSGLVITYQTALRVWETKQFRGVLPSELSTSEDFASSEFCKVEMWEDFGGSGDVKIETADTPEEDGTDAFSTGGAYTHVPAGLKVNTETSGVVKLQLVNAKDEAIGDEKQFPVGTGSGGSATIVTIVPDASPLYTKAGGTVLLTAEIRSTTTQGSTETSNGIERVELYDRDTNALLETYQASGHMVDNRADTYAFDISKYFTLAGQRRLRMVAYDDSDNTGSKNVNVIAVDVTIKSDQRLNYTTSTVLFLGGNTKMLPMYLFPNNASPDGIRCEVEIYLNNKWQLLGTNTVKSTNTEFVTINPNDCLGEVLTHGAYPLRIHGVDIASGVVGNYLHTAVMVVEEGNTTPIAVSRWYSEAEEAQIKRFETLTMDFAVYSSDASAVEAQIIDTTDNSVLQTILAQRSTTYNYIERVENVEDDGSVTLSRTVKAGSSTFIAATWNVVDSLIDIDSVSAMLVFDMDMRGRSNSDSDKTITDGGYELTVNGSNYSTNGFVKDSFGSEQWNKPTDNGVMALRIAENVTAELNYAPFDNNSIESIGSAIQFRIRVKNVADDEARLISCISGGYGFYVTGRQVVFTTDGATDKKYTITSDLQEDKLTDVAIVIEPTNQAPYGGIGCVKMYFDGELVGTCFYAEGSLVRHAAPISFDGSRADLYLYNIRAWQTTYNFEQSFNNYLLKMSDTGAMIKEYEFNQVMASQAAENKPATNRPQASALGESGLAYVILTKAGATDANDPKNHIDYIEGLKGDKKTEVRADWHIFFPGEPWRNVVIEDSPTTNQGTTSSMRPIKNKRTKTKKCKLIRMMYTLEQLAAMVEMTSERIDEYNRIAGYAANKKVQIKRGTLPTNVLCIKVDYSDSGGAHNGASTNQYNDLTRALGSEYMTPAQNANTGEFPVNPCIESIPIGLFRTDRYSTDATLPSNAYFHAKGNLNYDKSDAGVFGFEKVKGYNKDCLNYGDFYELIAARDQSLEDFLADEDKTQWNFPIDPEDFSEGYHDVVLVSEFCGPNYRIFRKVDGEWMDTTGTMTFSGGKWTVTGDVPNPVENYEIKVYSELAWFQGVNSLDDMLAPDEDGVPVWLQYFESRYPDDDNLNKAYEEGRKVPYRLYKWLRWCQACNQNLTEADGDITIDGVTVAGTAENRLLKFKRELHKEANVKSCVCYHVYTDYVNAVDQRSKNMMVGFYLDTDGVNRMYLNHMYDGDCLFGSDNDCGLTIPVELDPNNDPNGYFQGHDSVLFRQIYRSDYIWLKDYASDSDTSDSSKAITVASVCKAMREVTANVDGSINPFSPDGVAKYWISDRLSKYPKLVSSYDGLRKYVENSISTDNYFYALHGLSIDRLRQYVSTRFRFRDAYYQCGDLFKNAFEARCMGSGKVDEENIKFPIKAAKDGYFALCVDRVDDIKDGVYLRAGEEYTLDAGKKGDLNGTMIYLYGADRIGELDLSYINPKSDSFNISTLNLLRKLVLGTPTLDAASDSYNLLLKGLELGQLPFLEELDVRGFPLTSINARFCPRLKKLLATGCRLTSITLAETSPIEELTLPNTMKTLSLVNLPNLTFPNGNLTIEGLANVTSVELDGCPGIERMQLLTDLIDSGAEITAIRVPELRVTASQHILTALMESGAKGIGTVLESGCDGLTGRWILSELVEDEVLESFRGYFPALQLHNSQYTMVMFDDKVENDPENITNMENGTGYGTGKDFVASGHVLKIRKNLVPVFGKLNTQTNVWEGVRISDENYKKLYGGEDFNYTDSLGTGNDAMMYCKKLWYKGINDFKNEKKYICWSSSESEPLSTAENCTKEKLSDILYKQGAVVYINNIEVGKSTLGSDGVLSDASGYNVYILNVEGMKQVRYPGLNNANIGAVFLDESGVIIGTFNMAVPGLNFDFMEGDYIFTDIPQGAKRFVFASKNTHGSLEAIAVDSEEIEAIEPDWVQDGDWLGGVYHASTDSTGQLRSLSGANVRIGTGTSTTSAEWTYDIEGRPTNTPLSAMNYTMKDFQNLAARRGLGYQLIDYEISKLMAVLFYSLTGSRDAQAICGRGSLQTTTGYTDAIGNRESKISDFSNGANKILGFEGFVASVYEWMDNVLRNVPSYTQALKDGLPGNASYAIDAKWHIYDPISKSERVVDGITTNGCILRVKHGRYCDVIPTKTVTDTNYSKGYTDGSEYSNTYCRVVGRASYYGYASGGLVYAYSHFASSYSYTYYGSRLAFRGEIAISE